jgi:hypothetical protein
MQVPYVALFKYHLSLKSDNIHSLLCPNVDDLKLVQIFLDHESLKHEPKEKRFIGTMNVFDVDMKDHSKITNYFSS